MTTPKTQLPSEPAVASSDGLDIIERLGKLKLRKADMQLTVKEITADIENMEAKLYIQKLNAKTDIKKNRLRLALRMRASGKTFREVGDELGVGAARATQIFHQAERWNNMNRL